MEKWTNTASAFSDLDVWKLDIRESLVAIATRGRTGGQLAGSSTKLLDLFIWLECLEIAEDLSSQDDRQTIN